MEHIFQIIPFNHYSINIVAIVVIYVLIRTILWYYMRDLELYYYIYCWKQYHRNRNRLAF